MPNAIFNSDNIRRPFQYPIEEGGIRKTKEFSTRAKVAIVAIVIFSAPFVLFIGAIPLFFAVCALYKSRQKGFVRIHRARVAPIKQESREGRPARRSIFSSFASILTNRGKLSQVRPQSREQLGGRVPPGGEKNRGRSFPARREEPSFTIPAEDLFPGERQKPREDFSSGGAFSSQGGASFRPHVETRNDFSSQSRVPVGNEASRIPMDMHRQKKSARSDARHGSHVPPGTRRG